MPKVSVILPVYNTEKYLRKCIESILAQSFSDFELIIVSDGGEAENLICEEYCKSDSRVALIKDVKKGLGGARNAGLKIAQGEFIWFIDSDDWVEKDTLELAIDEFKQDIDLLVFGVNIQKETGCVKQKGLRKYLKNKFDGLVTLDKNVIFNTNVYAWNKIFKKSLIDNFSVSFPEMMQYEDFPFFYHYCAVAKKAFFLDKKFYNYFQRKDSGMAATFKNKYENIRQHFDCLRFLHSKLNGCNADKEYFLNIFSMILDAGLKYCTNEQKDIFLEEAYNLYRELELESAGMVNLIQLENKNFYKIKNKILSEKVFNVFNLLIIKVQKTKNNKTKVRLNVTRV